MNCQLPMKKNGSINLSLPTLIQALQQIECSPQSKVATFNSYQSHPMTSMYNIFTDTCTRMGPDLLSALGRAKFNNYNKNQMRDC